MQNCVFSCCMRFKLCNQRNFPKESESATCSRAMAEADARRLLNRAVASSPHDTVFMAEARRLAAAHPGPLLERLLTAASLDVPQTELMHKLLCRLPTLAQATAEPGAHQCDQQASAEDEPRLLGWLRETLGLASLPPTRQRALLLLLAKLVQPATDPVASKPGDCSAPRTAEAADAAGSPLADATGRADEPAMAHAAAATAPAAGAGAGAGASLPPLVTRCAMLTHVLLPLMRGWATDDSAPPEASPQLLLQATLQLLSGQALQPGGQQLGGGPPPSAKALGDAQLVGLFTSLLGLLPHRRSLESASVPLLLRCTHAAVQLLLPRVVGAARDEAASEQPAPGWFGQATRQWRELPWPVQLQAWPLLDRLECAAAAPAQKSARGTGAERLLLWLRTHARPTGRAAELLCVVVAASVPGVPAKQAMALLLPPLPPPDAAAPSPPPPPPPPPELSADVAAALARGLPRGTPMEFQLAASALLPALASRGCLPQCGGGLAPASGGGGGASSAEADRELLAVRCADALLCTMLVHQRAVRAADMDSGGGEAAREQLCFALGLAKWLGSTTQAAARPLALLQLLGLSLRAALESPPAARDRTLLVSMQLHHRLIASPHNDTAPRPEESSEDEYEDDQSEEEKEGAEAETETGGTEPSASPSEAVLNALQHGLACLRSRAAGDLRGDSDAAERAAHVATLEAMLNRI